ANPAAEDEATASFVLAERLGLQVGDQVELRFYRADHAAEIAVKLLTGLAPRIANRSAGEFVSDYADGPRVRFTVVGIEASPAEFPPLITDLAPVLHLTPAFTARYGATVVGPRSATS